MLFADIRGFTERSESMTPEAAIALLNDYFNHITASIHDAGGTVDKFLGDGIMAFFGAPQELPNSSKSALEAAQDIVESDPAEASLRIEAALEEAQRLQMIIEGLLVLSRADSNSYPDIQRINLSEIAQERTESWAALADDSGVTVRLRAPSTACWVRAVPNVLEQVIDNYVDNALSVAPQDSTIEIRIERGPRLTTLHVCDEGPGLPEQDLERAFHRFWRGRSDSSGTGLGLAIVDRLVAVSGGRVRLTNRSPHGLDAQAEFLNA